MSYMNEWLSIITIIAMSSSASLATFSCHMPMAARIMAALMVVVLGWWLLVSLCFCCSTDSSRLYPAFHVLDLLITSSGARQDNLPSRRTHLWLAFFFVFSLLLLSFIFRLGFCPLFAILFVATEQILCGCGNVFSFLF